MTAVASEAIQKCRGTNCRREAPVEKIFDVPLNFSVVPLQVGGHNKNRVGTANSFLSVLMR